MTTPKDPQETPEPIPPNEINGWVRIDGGYDPIWDTEAGWEDKDFDYGPNEPPPGKDFKPKTPFG